MFKVSKIVLVLSILPVIVFFFGAQFLAEFVFNKAELTNYFLIISASIPFMILHELLCYYFVSIKKTLFYSLITFIFPNVLFLIFLVIVFYFKLPTSLVLACYTLAYLISVLVG